jgi:hypothetical protein
MTAYTFRISLDCPHCRGGIPVNGFTNEVLCSNCLKGVELSQDWWDGHLDNETLAEAIAMDPGTGNSSTSLGGLNERIESGNRPPRCQGCKHEFDYAVMQKAADQGGFECPGCKQRIRVRKATPLALSLIPEADLLVHEDETGDGLGSDGAVAAEPMMFACLSCGGGLSVDGSTRTPKCLHCGNANYLPDSLWLRLHPAPTSHAFFVTRGKDSKHSEITIENFPSNLTADRALKILKDDGLAPNILYKIFECMQDEDDVLEALAKHKRASDTLLINLCDTDLYYQIRVNVAKRQDLSTAVIEQLALDTDSDVKEALVRRPGLYKLPQKILEDVLRDMDVNDLGKGIEDPNFPEWKLYELSDSCTPDDANRILRSPNVSVRVLKRLGTNPDNRPRVKEHRLYQELGWFRKLFFFG